LSIELLTSLLEFVEFDDLCLIRIDSPPYLPLVRLEFVRDALALLLLARFDGWIASSCLIAGP
jgi:hypothetical protein